MGADTGGVQLQTKIAVLRRMAELYGGGWFTVRQHMAEGTAIAEYLYETVGVPESATASGADPLEPRTEYGPHLGTAEDRRLLPVVVAGAAEMVAKIMLMGRLGIPEGEVYGCAAVREAETELSALMCSLGPAELGRLAEALGPENLRMLNGRLDEGYVRSFGVYGDGMVSRGLCLFQLMGFAKYRELGWFRFMGCPADPEVRTDIERMAARIADRMWGLLEGGDVDFFPVYGSPGRLTAMADLRIGDKLILISGLPAAMWDVGRFRRCSAILNACQQLAEGGLIRRKMVYHPRWDGFSRVA